MSNPVARGASVAYDAVKQVLINGKNVAKTSTALITPNVSQVGKVLGRGVAGYALSVAVEQLLGQVDWVLDPANNQIKYKPKDETSPFPPPEKNYQYECAPDKFLANSIQECGARYISKYSQYNKYSDCKRYSGESISCLFTYTNSTRQENVDIGKRTVRVQPIEPPKEQEEKTIPLDVVAQQVISNAQSGDASAQVATTAAVADIVNDAQNDDAKARPIVNQLEANAKTQTDADANTATGESTANPETGATDLSLEFPTFCGWAPQVCEAAQVVISFPQTLTNWWETSKQKTDSWAKAISDAYTSAKEWFQKEPEKDSEGTFVRLYKSATTGTKQCSTQYSKQ